MPRFLLSLLCLLPLLGHAAGNEPLDPAQAYRFSAKMLNATTVAVHYQIAKGYHLYRDKFKFSVQPAGVTLGPPQLPAGQEQDDIVFGKVAVFNQPVTIQLPLIRTDPSIRTITLTAVSQGCSDVAGVCYPPQTQQAQLKLPAMAPATAQNNPAGGVFQPPSRALSSDEFLPPDEAFKLTVTPMGGNTLSAQFKPAASYYLYRDKIHFTLKSTSGAAISQITLPPGETKSDPTFGKTEVYHHPFQALIQLRNVKQGDKLALTATYQGCSEKGVCYPPQTKIFDLVLGGGVQPAATTPRLDGRGEPPAASAIARLLQSGNFWLIVTGFFGFGLLLTFTPCVFPMIPILSGIIIGQGQALTKTRGFVLSLAYVLGMAITYAIAGVAAALSGTLLSNALQNPWVLGSFAALFVLLAFSMFGFYELQLPSAIQSRFTNASNKMKGGTLAGVFVMGVLSAVIVGPCVTAPLAGALLYISQTHNVWLGGSALFAMGLGMGVPLLLVGVSAGTLLPRAGNWMNAVKGFFGVLLLGVAIWLISPLISTWIHMSLWAALLIISSIYLHAIDPLPANASGFGKFWKGIGIIALIGGIALLLGVLGGNRDILQPLAGLRGAATAAPTHLNFQKVTSIADLEQKIQSARGRYVMLDFYADWCVSCKEMERFTFSDPRVQQRLRDVVLLQADVTDTTPDDKALLKKFGLFGPPGIIFFDRQGNERKNARIIGDQPPEKFLARLNQILR